jgi:hypothetical protein
LSLYFKWLAIGGTKAFRFQEDPSRLETFFGSTLPALKCLALFQWVRQLKSEANDVYLIMKLTMLGVLIRGPTCRLAKEPRKIYTLIFLISIFTLWIT